MKQVQVNTAGFTLNANVPETVDEYNNLAKRAEGCLEDAIANTLYRSVFAEFRSEFVAAVAKDTGIEPINSGTEDEPVWESDGKYIKRVQAALNLTKDAFVAKYQSLAQSLMDAIAFDPSQRERSSDGPKVGKKDKAMAEEILGTEEKPSKYDEATKAAVVAKLGSILGREVLPTVDSLARALADKRRADAAALEAQTKSALGL